LLTFALALSAAVVACGAAPRFPHSRVVQTTDVHPDDPESAACMPRRCCRRVTADEPRSCLDAEGVRWAVGCGAGVCDPKVGVYSGQIQCTGANSGLGWEWSCQPRGQ
jgi:hypothetical protein